MPASRRTFLKNSAVASAGVALGTLPASGALLNAVAAQTISHGKVSADSHSAPSASNAANQFTRGLGIYPGDPREDFAPELVIDRSSYHNLALHRPAYHSSSYDYNVTAQLVTDGIKETRWPTWIATSTSSAGVLSKIQRELVLDHSRTTSIDVRGSQAMVEIQLRGGNSVPAIDRVDVVVIPPYGTPASNLEFTVSVSDDSRDWQKVGSVSAPEPASVEGYPGDFALAGQLFVPSISLSPACHSRFYQIACTVKSALPQFHYLQWRIGEIAFYGHGQRVNIGGPYDFTSAWMSEGLGEEWIYVDLGARCQFDRIKLFWIARAADGSIQVSDDTERWVDLHHLTAESGLVDDVKLPRSAQGRYVRVLMKRPTSPDGYYYCVISVELHKKDNWKVVGEAPERGFVGVWQSSRDYVVRGEPGDPRGRNWGGIWGTDKST
ncbi:MAG: discoidin domain-containing protein [Candidatus Sulfotelmatobacter sp.]